VIGITLEIVLIVGTSVANRKVMDLAFWLPALFFLGLATLMVLFAFVYACERV
jgi:hypothetical protein